MSIFLFWLLLFLILWSLFGYGLVWIGLARVLGRRDPAPPETPPETPLRVTMLIAARNEAGVIRDKLETVLAQDTGPHHLNVLVVSDGSEDGTLAKALSLGSPAIDAFQTETHGGKARALTAGLARISSDVVVFSDANSLLVPGALRHLLRPFGSPEVGGVCGQPQPKPSRGGWFARVEALFWRYDSGIKAAESAFGGVVSAQGTLYAMRRDLVPAVVPDAMADDFFISVQAPAASRRLVLAPEAVAVETVTARTGDEFMRRVRSTERGWRALWAMRGLMNPRRHGLYALQLVSHKLLRRLVAFLLPLLLLVNVLIAGQAWYYAAMLAVQAAIYLLAAAAILWPRARRLPGAGQAAFFVFGHVAMGWGIVRAALGVRSTRWVPVRERVQ